MYSISSTLKPAVLLPQSPVQPSPLPSPLSPTLWAPPTPSAACWESLNPPARARGATTTVRDHTGAALPRRLLHFKLLRGLMIHRRPDELNAANWIPALRLFTEATKTLFKAALSLPPPFHLRRPGELPAQRGLSGQRGGPEEADEAGSLRHSSSAAAGLRVRSSPLPSGLLRIRLQQ